MKKQMKMKKYAEGGMSDDDEGYDAYTTRVTDDEGEVLYEKPEPKYKESKPAAKKAESKKAESKKAESKKAEPKKAEPKKAEPKKEPEAYRDFSKLARGAVERERSDKEKAENAKNAKRLGELGMLALPVGRVAKAASDVGKAANMARATRYEREAMFGNSKAARKFAEAGGMKRGGKVKGYSSGGSVKSSASRRADGIASRGKTRGRMI